MFTTQELLTALRSANPTETVTEDRLRHAIRRGDLQRPRMIGRQFMWGPDDVQSVAEVLRLSLPAETQAEEAVIGTRGTLHAHSPGEDYGDDEARRIGGRLGWEWAGDNDHQVALLREADADGVLHDPTARTVARVFLPEDEWGSESCWWEAIVGDYAYLTDRQAFVEGFIAGALLRR